MTASPLLEMIMPVLIFWPLGDRYIMPFFSHMSGGQYLLGDYDKKRDKFLVSHAGKFNFGPATPSDVHAPSATPDGKGGVIVIFNMNPGKPTGEWNQIMTLPRRLTLVGNDDLRQEPVGDIESLRYNRQEVKPMALPANKEVVMKDIKGDAMELNMEIDLKDASMLELNVLRSPNKEEFTRIVFFKQRGFQGRPYEIPGREISSLSSTALLQLNHPIPHFIRMYAREDPKRHRLA